MATKKKRGSRLGVFGLEGGRKRPTKVKRGGGGGGAPAATPTPAPPVATEGSGTAGNQLDTDAEVKLPPLADQLSRQAVPCGLDDKKNRERWKLDGDHGRGPYLIELNVQYAGGLPAATREFLKLFREVMPEVAKRKGMPKGMPKAPEPVAIGKSYYRCEMRPEEWGILLGEDAKRAASRRAADLPHDMATPAPADQQDLADDRTYRSIYRLWPDFPVKNHISRSVSTVKADAALRAFEARGEQITWAVIDSGVDFTHPHFGDPAGDHALGHASVRELHRCFVKVKQQVGSLQVPRDLPDPDSNPEIENRRAIVEQHRKAAWSDEFGHGTHVAGIITGRAPQPAAGSSSIQTVVLERDDELNVDAKDGATRVQRTRPRAVSAQEAARFHGVAPGCRLVSLKVLDDQGEGRSSDVIRALVYIRETLNDNPKMLRVQGVNLSVGYEFDAEMFACGQSPLCDEVNRLVLAGVVVVTAAGNTGYGLLNAGNRVARVGLSNTINDPGNAELALTVGATHREAPHRYGVSYFSSKGPTGDGRLKPDLVAPGERILSCGAGKRLLDARTNMITPADPQPVATSAQGGPAAVATGQVPEGAAYYIEESGTSMAAPHVSGAIAAFLSIRREFIGRPLDVKRIFMASAIPLGRERYFEGHGLLDLMKAIQSV